MNCPPEIAEVILDLVQTGILRIRALAWSSDAGRVAEEADHIHNLITLLKSYSADLLKYYWEIERPSLMEKSVDIRQFEELWQKLRPYVESPNHPALTPLRK